MSTDAQTGEVWAAHEPGVLRLARRVRCAALSHDDGWLALGSSGGVRVVELETGRVAMQLRGAPVVGLGWLGREQLLVVREPETGPCRAMVHAVPDGGLVSGAALAELNPMLCQVQCGAPGYDGEVSTVMVAPARWHGGLRGSVRRRLGYTLSGPNWDAPVMLDPDALTVLPRLPSVRSAVAALSPDGQGYCLWLSEPDPKLGVNRPGTLLLVRDWRNPRPEVVCRVGRALRAMRFTDASHLVLTGVDDDTPQARGELYVVDLFRRQVLLERCANEIDLWPLGLPQVDVDPDGARALVVAGLGAGAPARRPTLGLEALDVTAGMTDGPPRPLRATMSVGAGAAWLDQGHDAVALFSATSLQNLALTALASPAAAQPRDRGRQWDFALNGKALEAPQITRSPAGRYLALTWRSRDARERGAATDTLELALVPRDRLVALASG